MDAPVEALATREPEVESQGRGPLTPREKLRWDVPLLAAEVAVLLEVPEKTVRNAAKDRRLVRCGTLAQSSVFTWKAVLGWLGATDDER